MVYIYVQYVVLNDERFPGSGTADINAILLIATYDLCIYQQTKKRSQIRLCKAFITQLCSSMKMQH